MFYFLCKTSLHGRNGYTIKAQNPLMVLSAYFRCMSSDANQNTFTVSYLIKRCGLSPESAVSASRRVQFETPDKPELVLSFLENSGFSKVHIADMIRKYPKMLSANIDHNISPKVEFFRSRGFSTPEIGRILTSYPWIFRISLENTLIPAFNCLRDLVQSHEKTISVIRHSPRILACNYEANVIPNINTLRENGVPEANILLLVHYHPQKVDMDAAKFKKLVNDVKAMGFNPLKSQFVLSIVALKALSKSKWIEKVVAYKKWGWSEEDIVTAFGKYPWCMTISEDKIMAIMDFYVNKLGLDSLVISHRPLLLSLSLKKRLVPRAAVIQFLSSKGLIRIDSGITRMLECTEQTFMEKYVNCYEEASQLLKLYNEKLNICKQQNQQ